MPDPIVRTEGTRIVCLWPHLSVGMAFDNIRDHSDGLTAEVSVYTLDDQLLKNGHVHWAKLNLASTPARSQFAKHLATRVTKGKIDWFSLVEFGCTTTAIRVRTPAALSVLSDIPMTLSSFAVTPILPAGETTILYGDGGTGKSYLALLLSCAVITGKALPGGIRPLVTGPVLYLDYETHAQEQASRLTLCARGLGLTNPPDIHYRSLHRALVDDLATIKADVAQVKAVMVVVDSIGPACGGEPESAEVILRFMNALRELGSGVTRCVLSHISKSDLDRRRARPFGSAFVRNLARACWEVRRVTEEDTEALTMGLFHEKSNSGRLHAPIGLVFSWEAPTMLTVKSTPIAEVPELAASTSLAFRIRHELQPGPMALSLLAEHLGAKEDSIYRSLRRMHGVVMLEGGKGKGRESVWSLRADEIG